MHPHGPEPKGRPHGAGAAGLRDDRLLRNTVREMRRRPSSALAADRRDARRAEFLSSRDLDEEDGGGGTVPVDRAWLRRVAFHYLERYAVSEGRLAAFLRRKIARRAAESGSVAPADRDAAVGQVIEGCRALGLIDDARVAELKVASGRRKGLSSRKLAQTLAVKGFDRETAAQAIADNETGDVAAALNLARRRRLGPWRVGADADRPGADRTPADRTRIDREIAALCRAGYPYRLARRVILMTLDDAQAELGLGD